MYYGNKSVFEIDSYYGIGLKGNRNYPWRVHKDCERIQQAFIRHAIILTLLECKELYETWSDKIFSSSWEIGLDDKAEEDIFKLLFPMLNNMVKDKTERLATVSKELEQCQYREE